MDLTCTLKLVNNVYKIIIIIIIYKRLCTSSRTVPSCSESFHFGNYSVGLVHLWTANFEKVPDTVLNCQSL